MQIPEGYSPYWYTFDPNEMTITIRYNENILRDDGILKRLTDICENVDPMIEESLKKKVSHGNCHQ